MSRLTIAALLLLGCEGQMGAPSKVLGIDADRHAWFPIGAGMNHALGRAAQDGKLACSSCHLPSAASFREFECTTCHEHAEEVLTPAHAGVPDFRFDSQACLTCHIDGTVGPGGGAPSNAFDPAHDVMLDALLPTWSGSVVTAFTTQSQTLHMTMNHSSTQIPVAAMSACTNCHADAAAGRYDQALLHASLNDLSLAPSGCSDCHSVAMPVGFVGPLAAGRTPASPAMRHDAVAGAMKLVPGDCGLCHLAPTSDVASTWASRKSDGASPVLFHASLSAATQPVACLDCHATSRPAGLVTLSNGSTFDHQQPEALGECKTCHTNPAALAGQSWGSGTFHAPGAAAPATCLPCHEGERPSSTAGWTSATYTRSPFDYGTNARGITHGAGQDCAGCHTRTLDWTGASFPHGAGTAAATRCVSCHSTQRPDLLSGATAASMSTLLGFDHALNGTGDCFGCHQASVTAARYTDLYRAGAAQTAPNVKGGDWAGGIAYPSSFSSSVDQSITLTETSLLRAPSGLVTGTSSVSSTYYNGMLHTSTMVAVPNVPAGLAPGTAGNPNMSTCWHCHTNTNGTVTAYSNGKYHASLDGYRATPAGAIAPVAQPTKQCGDCHATMLPAKVVQKGLTNLQPMDHGIAFTAAVSIAGQNVSRVSQLDCSTCHVSPGGAWSDGVFHVKTGSAQPADCVSCHYVVMADAAKADLATLPRFQMKHRSAQVSSQACASCHVGAFARSTGTVAAALWREASGPATFHPHVSAQPGACLDCHAVSQPPGATPSTTLYAPTAQYQWMNHASPQVAGRECALCHLTDAKSSGSAWNKAAKLHGPLASVSSCRECHGLANGMGNTPGSNNNMPSALVSTSTVTSASASTGVAGQRAQISHADANVTASDCKTCHTSPGSTWAGASFHKNFSAAKPLVVDGTTGRCSHCHLNVKPTAAYTAQDHSSFNATTGQDCSSCHAYPGTNASSPNWLGATGAHASTGSTSASALDCATCHGLGGSSATRLTVAASSHFGGVANGNRCITCHVDFTAFKGAVTVLKYGHSNATANASGCASCHAFKSQVYTTMTSTPALNHPVAGQPRQFSQTLSVTGSFDGRTFNSPHTDPKMTLCGSCHQYAATAAATNVWPFKHRPSNPGISNGKSTGGCNQCH